MKRLWQSLTSSIGKKELVAVSGLGLLGFLAAHLAGNMLIYKSADAFNSYAANLHAESLAAPKLVFEAGLLTLALLHIVLALSLALKNRAARPVSYQMKKSAGGRSLGSRTMVYTGPLILTFVVFHLLQFTFIQSEHPIYTIVTQRFSEPLWVAFYSLSMVVVGLHISHGFWSAGQTLGLPLLRRGLGHRFSAGLSLVFMFGFGLIPIFVFFLQGLSH